MSRVQKRDYYYGSALSIFLSKNQDSRPSLVECSDLCCQYKMISDTSQEFHLYMKYTGQETSRVGDERVWRFPLTDADKQRISKCIDSGLNTYLILICGCKDLCSGEIAVLTQSEYEKVAHKTNIGIKLQGKSPKKYLVIDRKSDRSFAVPRNRFDGKITDIKECIGS